MNNHKCVQITDRDLELFRFVNSFRYVQARHIFAKFHVSRKFYQRLSKLCAGDWLIHENIIRNMPGHYRCTKNSTDISSDELLPARQVVMGTYEHDMLVIDLALEMERRTKGRWITERQLRHGDEDEQGLRAWSRHYPDGLIELPNGERVAIEFERSNWKTTPRIKDIIKSYLDGSSAVKRINGVMYFAYNEGIKDKVARAITQAGGGRTIQVRMLSEIMQGRGAGDGTGA